MLCSHGAPARSACAVLTLADSQAYWDLSDDSGQSHYDRCIVREPPPHPLNSTCARRAGWVFTTGPELDGQNWLGLIPLGAPSLAIRLQVHLRPTIAVNHPSVEFAKVMPHPPTRSATGTEAGLKDPCRPEYLGH